MSSVIEIINSALTTLAIDPISALSDATEEATAANAKWEISRRAVLRMYNWNFAIKRAVLAQNVMGPTNEYTYAYTLPSDLLKVIKVIDDFNFKVEGGQVITDADTCNIKYVYDVTDTELWDSTFTDLMVARLAMELSYTFPRDGAMIPAMTKLYAMKLNDAKTMNSSEDIADELGSFDNSLVNYRY